MFRSWQAASPPWLVVHALELPGHGSRFREPLVRQMSPLVEAFAIELAPFLDQPFAIFGHSMGALLGFELTRHIRRYYGTLPECLFAAGCRAPSLPELRPPVHALPDGEFREALRWLGGTPRQVLEDEELLKFVTPILRADLAVVETYEYLEDEPLTGRLIAFGGAEDPEAPGWSLEGWKQQTSGPSKVRVFPGGHFFVYSARDAVVRAVAEELTQQVRPGHESRS